MTLDEEGKPAVNFGISRHTRFVPPLDEVLETPAKIATQHHRDVVIVMREAVSI